MTVGTFFIGFSYLHAQWQGPTAPPPQENVAAPVNVSANAQVKAGSLGVDVLATPYTAGDRRAVGASAWTMMGGSLNDNGNRIGGSNSQLRTNSTDGRTIDSDGFATRIFDQASNNRLRFQNSGLVALSGPDASGNEGDEIDWQDTFTIFGDGRVGATEFCNLDGRNCINITERGLNLETRRFNYWRQGRQGAGSRTSTATIPPPPSGPDWDTCAIAADSLVPLNWQTTRCLLTTDGEFCENGGFVHPDDRVTITPQNWLDRAQQYRNDNNGERWPRSGVPPLSNSETTAVSSALRGGPSCGVYRGRENDGDPITWRVRMSLGDPQYMGTCGVQCHRVGLDDD